MDILMLSAVSPFAPFDGHRLAVLSDVRACLDSGFSLGVMAFTYGEETGHTVEPLCPYEALPAKGGNFAVRLARGLLTRVPPSTERLYSERAYAQIRSKLLEWRPEAIILNDASVSAYIPLIRNLLPAARIVVRSHNVMHDVRTIQLERTASISKPLVALDTRRYIAMEQAAILECDEHWAISQTDAKRFQQLYGRPSKVLSVSIDSRAYSSIFDRESEPATFVHIGSIDFRRRLDLSRFLHSQWAKIHTALPAARLVFAGRVSGRPVPAPNASYLGFVQHDKDAYRLGRFALNFQSTSGGVKIKTLTAFAAGRVLLSGPIGVEGFDLQAGTHYIDLEALDSVPIVKQSLGNPDDCAAVAAAGREYVNRNHSFRVISQQFLGNLT